jgi:menaquinone-dependent protoporphyrinogen oxidase
MLVLRPAQGDDTFVFLYAQSSSGVMECADPATYRRMMCASAWVAMGHIFVRSEDCLRLAALAEYASPWSLGFTRAERFPAQREAAPSAAFALDPGNSYQIVVGRTPTPNPAFPECAEPGGWLISQGIHQEDAMSPRRILIVYASHYGQTAKVAQSTADRLRAAGAAVLVTKVGDFSRRITPGSFDGVIIGASVNFGKHQRSIRRFVRANRDELLRIPSAFYSVSGAECSPDEAPRTMAKQYIANFVREAGWQPAMTESVAGAMAYTKYPLPVRWLIKRISQKEGAPADTTRDYEYTDWEQVRRFADRFAEAQRTPEAVAVTTL